MKLITRTCVSCLLLLVTQGAVAQQSDASRRALEVAAAKGSVPAQYALGAAAEADGDLSKAASWYRQAAEHGYAAAQFKLGDLLETGKGVDADVTEAVDWYRKAAAQGFAPAIARLDVLQPSSKAAPATVDTGSTAATEQPSAVAAEQQVAPTNPVVAPSATLSSAAPIAQKPSGSSESDSLWDVMKTRPKNTLFLVILPGLYLLLSTYCGVRLLRPRLLNWYRSGSYLITTSGRSGSFLMGGQMGELLFKQMLMRLQVEVLAVSLGALVGCVGGNIYYLVTTRSRRVAVEGV